MAVKGRLAQALIFVSAAPGTAMEIATGRRQCTLGEEAEPPLQAKTPQPYVHGRMPVAIGMDGPPGRPNKKRDNR